MVPTERIELPTNGLQNRCSTAELRRHFSLACLTAKAFIINERTQQKGGRKAADLNSPGFAL